MVKARMRGEEKERGRGRHTLRDVDQKIRNCERGRETEIKRRKEK